MRFALWIVILASLSEACREDHAQVELTVISANAQSVVIGVVNGSGQDVVLLSPSTPSRSVDAEGCTVELSTKIDERILPFAFTPDLVALGDGHTRQFRAALDPLQLSKGCTHWTVIAEYAYIRPDEVEMFKKETTEAFRQYVLKHQQVVTTSASVILSQK